jgi:hypothetical protein
MVWLYCSPIPFNLPSLLLKERGGWSQMVRDLNRLLPKEIRRSVLLHLDQHFIERGPYRSGRERTLEIGGRGRNAGSVIYPMCCVLPNSASGLYNQLSLLPSESRTRARVERTATFPVTWPQDLEGGGLSARFAGDLLLLGEPEDHHHQQGHQQQGQKAICKGREKSASDRLCQSWNSKETFLFWLMHMLSVSAF